MEYIQPFGDDPGASYTDADPVAGIMGSAVPAAAIEHPQREIVNVIAAAGLVPDAEDLTQLGAAIQAMLAASRVPLASDADAAAMVRDDAALTPANLAALFAGSKGSGGYQMLPGGLIIQWGQANAGNSGHVAFNYPIAFPTDALALVGSQSDPGTYSSTTVLSLRLLSASQGSARQDSSGNRTFNFIAIGH